MIAFASCGATPTTRIGSTMLAWMTAMADPPALWLLAPESCMMQRTKKSGGLPSDTADQINSRSSLTFARRGADFADLVRLADWRSGNF
ncbi:MAG TPA: hypothetical protein VNW15_15460 [Rhizomicrobium sp.]|jgi:hypothetical protein|nr:hypothetical protein [Rhizomicrobium sp.]